MTGGYTILNLGGNLFTVAATEGEANGTTVEGIYDRIERNSLNKPFLLENYSLLEGREEKARFVAFSEVGGGFEAAFYANPNEESSSKLVLCVVRVEGDDTVKFFMNA
jgi:hypothetical protein